MLGRHVGLVALVALSAAGFVAVGCGSDDPAPAGPGETAGTGGTGGTNGGAGTAGSDAAAGAAGTGPEICDAECEAKYKSAPGVGEPPAKPESAPAGDGTTDTYFAVQRLYIGDTDFSNNANPDAWKDIGFNIDGYTSDKDFSGHCQALSKQVKKDVRTDGNNGIDNAFGNIIIAQGTLPIDNASQTASDAIAGGSFSLVMKFANLGAQASYSSVSAQVIPAAMPDGVVPKFDGKDSWSPFDPTTAPPIDFTGGWVTENTWVSGSKGDLPLNLEISGVKLTLTIQDAQISATMNADHTEITRGIIGGSLKTDDLINNLKGVAGGFNLCGDAFDSIAETVRQASDSLAAGGQNPAVVCDSISIGIGFTGTLAGPMGAPLPAKPPEPDPCADQ
jgi:hypothetical protein